MPIISRDPGAEVMLVEGPVVSAQIGLCAEAEEAYIKDNVPIPEPITVKMLIDTGSMGTGVKKEITDALGITPIGETKVITAVGEADCDRFQVDFVIEGNIPLGSVPVVAFDSAIPGIDGLIGRDRLADMMVVYNGFADRFSITF